MVSFFSHTVIFISLLNSGSGPTFAHFISWVVAVAFELAILATSLHIFVHSHWEPIVGDLFGGPLRKGITQWEYAEVVCVSIRALVLALLVALYILQSDFTKVNVHQPARATETTGLLDPSTAVVESNEHGTTDGRNTPEPWTRPTTTPTTSLWEYVSGYQLFFPYLWPSKSCRLQILFIFCIGLLILQRIINVLAPYQAGVIIDTLSWKEGQLQVPWGQICLYITYRWLQGSQGLIDSVRSNLWISITQYSYMELSTAAFEHVHNLSLDFHLGKKIGEVLSALTKGSSINTFLEQITFQVLPTLIDLVIAVLYFLFAFDAYYAIVITIMTFCYLYVTVRIMQWRAEMRRQMVNAQRQEDAIK